MPQRVTTEAVVTAYRETGSVWKAAKRLGIIGQSVWERLRAIDYPMQNRRWTSEEIEELKALVDQCPLAEVAQRLGRPYYGVALKASRLGINTRAGSRGPRKPPRGSGLTKDRIKGIVRDLENFDGSWRQFCRSRGFSLDVLAMALQTHAPEYWLRESKARGLYPKVCPNCEGEFYPVTTKQITCTRRCAGQLFRDVNYFGGKRKHTIGLREKTCQLCLRTRDRGLQSHHVLGKENDPENEWLVALCSGCHQAVSLLASMKVFDTEEGWERLIELVMARRLAEQDKPYAGTHVAVDMEWLTKEDLPDLGIIQEAESESEETLYAPPT